MARLEKEIEEIARRIEALSPRGRTRLLERVLTPERELELAAEELRKHVRVKDERKIDRAVDRALRRIRRERTASR